MGGSAYSMAHQISEGYVMVNERTFTRLLPPELEKLSFELDKLMREVRSDQPSLEDIPAIQQRNRKISRLQSAQSMLASYRMRRRR